MNPQLEVNSRQIVGQYVSEKKKPCIKKPTTNQTLKTKN